MINALVGGSLIGFAAVWFMLSVGRIAGISGIVASAVTQPRSSLWALLFILGIGLGGFLGTLIVEVKVIQSQSAISLQLILGGLFVGVGTRMGSGCTSGHGVCGIARYSKRSTVATAVFLVVGMVTATLVSWS
ncbi:MAG: putative membrane protein YedE/YeeE [Candidatus Azotimanducaceae bacterium]|jgi:uncharacterized membrane protein YedE/YeeE